MVLAFVHKSRSESGHREVGKHRFSDTKESLLALDQCVYTLFVWSRELTDLIERPSVTSKVLHGTHKVCLCVISK